MRQDRDGRIQLVSMDRPERLLRHGLVSSLRALDEHSRRGLVQGLRAEFDRIWGAQDAFEFSPNEEEYVEADPPEKYRLGSPTQRLDASALLSELERIPVRWRVDVAMALSIFLEIDLDPDFADG